MTPFHPYNTQREEKRRRKNKRRKKKRKKRSRSRTRDWCVERIVAVQALVEENKIYGVKGFGALDACALLCCRPIPTTRLSL